MNQLRKSTLRSRVRSSLNKRSPLPTRTLRPLGLALSLLLFSQTAFAECSCPRKPGLKAAYDAASMVLVGRIEEQGSTPLKPGFQEVQVTVLRRFKDDGELRRDMMVFYTPEKEEDCGIGFQPGFEYLIFANGNPAFYKTSACDRTEVLENAQVDIHRLAKLAE